MSKLLESALAYAEAGIPVFPITATKKAPPLTGKGGCKLATTNTEQIKSWWTEFPNANIGVNMGPESGLMGLDLDFADGLPQDFIKRLPKTVMSRSPRGGLHAYFKHPGEIKNGKVIEKGCTVRSNNYYFVLPPSHVIDPEKEINGPYKWPEPRTLADGEIAECPQWIIEHTGTVKEKADGTSEGSRHEFLKTKATHLRFLGKNKNEILVELKKFNETFPDGPKPDKEVESIVEWVMDTIEPDVNAKGTTPHDIAQAFLYDNGFIDDNGLCKLRYYRQDFYRYKNNCYQRLDDEWVDDLLNRWLVERGLKKIAGSSKPINAILKMLKTKPVYMGDQVDTPCWIDNGHTEKRSWLVPLQNGIFDIKKFVETGEWELKPHSPNFFCTYVLPFSFDDKAECPLYDKFLSEVIEDREVHESINEMLGVHMYTPFLLEKFFVLVGEGSNGKSVLRTILTSLLGRENVSSVGLECFNSNNFSFQLTLNKLSNIIPDMKDISNIDEGVLKQFVSREPMIFNRKNKPAIETTPTAFLTVCTNQLPRFTDKSKGVWRRLIIFNFEKEIPEAQQNPKMREPAFWEGELSGIFNRALAGILRVVREGRIAETGKMKEAVTEHQMDMNNVAQFVDECLEPGDGSETTKAVYRCYRNMVLQNGGRPLGNRQFLNQLRAESKHKIPGLKIDKMNRRVGNYSGRFVDHVSFTKSALEYLDTVDKLRREQSCSQKPDSSHDDNTASL